MTAESAMSKIVDQTERQEQYDRCVKKILSQKIILAWILKECVREFAPYSVERIAEECIEGQPEVSAAAVDRDGAEQRIVGMNTEDSSLGEGTVFYDIIFAAVVPDSKEPMQLIISVEGQRADNVAYPLLKRAVYYGSRMISAQKNTVFVKSHYEQIRKVYSIWINLNLHGEEANTVNSYSNELPRGRALDHLPRLRHIRALTLQTAAFRLAPLVAKAGYPASFALRAHISPDRLICPSI